MATESKSTFLLRPGRALAAALLAALVALALTAAPARATNGVTMTCSTRSLSSLPLRPNGRRVDVVSLTAQGMSCGKALVLARRVAKELAHGAPVALPGLIGLSTVSTSACGSCAPSTRVSLTFAHGTVNVALEGVGAGAAPGGGAFSIPSFPRLPVPSIPFPAAPPQGSQSTLA